MNIKTIFLLFVSALPVSLFSMGQAVTLPENRSATLQAQTEAALPYFQQGVADARDTNEPVTTETFNRFLVEAESGSMAAQRRCATPSGQYKLAMMFDKGVGTRSSRSLAMQ